MSFLITWCLCVFFFFFYSFDFFFRTNRPNSTKFCTKHPYGKGIVNCLNKGRYTRNNEDRECVLKIFFSRTTSSLPKGFWSAPLLGISCYPKSGFFSITRSLNPFINQPNDERFHTFNITGAVIAASIDIWYWHLEIFYWRTTMQQVRFKC